MPDKFEGTYQELQDKVNATGISGMWRELEDDKKQYIAKNGAKISWWERKKTISFQGKAAGVTEFKAIFNSDNVAKVSTPVATKVAPQSDKKPQIFIVHGHDDQALEQLEFILTKLELDPYILKDNDGRSRTLIEALEQQIQNKNTAFGIILMTPDDYGYSKDENEEKRQHRARQNVILEMGMVLASLGRKNMVIIRKGAVEYPSDIGSMIRLDFDKHVKEVAMALVKNIKAAGIPIPDELIEKVA